jgi:large subunit ribosomal protein L4
MAIKAPWLGKSGTVELDAAVFGEDFHMSLVHETVKAELNARRRGTASTLGRGEVAMTGAKAWRQKGTGRARVGALSVPHRTGGGVAFGPKPRGFTVKVNRKARRRALRAALALQAARGSLAVLDPAGFDRPSTKQAAAALADFGAGGALVVLDGDDVDDAALSFRNLRDVSIGSAEEIGVADVVGAARLVLTPGAIDALCRLAAPPERAAAAQGGEAA